MLDYVTQAVIEVERMRNLKANYLYSATRRWTGLLCHFQLVVKSQIWAGS